MSRVKRYTPGPWFVADGCSWRRILQKGTDAEVIVPTNSVTDGWPDLTAEAGKRDANLTLAAAAPELLEELESRFEQTRCGCNHPACKRCKDDAETERVIAKAHGEQQ